MRRLPQVIGLSCAVLVIGAAAAVLIRKWTERPQTRHAESTSGDSVDARVVELITGWQGESKETDDELVKGSTLLPTIRTMLREPKYGEYAVSIMSTIGMYGDSTDLPRLVDCLEGAYRTDPLGSDSLNIAGAMIGLGYLSNRVSGAFWYLRAATNPDFFLTDRFGPAVRSDESLRVVLSGHAILGLGLSVRPGTEEFLKSIPRRPSDPAYGESIEFGLEKHREMVARFGYGPPAATPR